MTNPKICFAASSGGHLMQLMSLKPLMQKYDSFIVTEQTDYESVKSDRPVYYLKQVNRKEILFPFYMLSNLVRSIGIIHKENPDIVITTGVLAVIPVCLWAKLLHKKLIYIESFAKVTDATLTGKLMYKFADAFFVQWEPMLKVFPKARYVGGIY